jgi:hypothetical protein
MGFRQEFKKTFLMWFSIGFALIYGAIAICMDLMVLPVTIGISLILDKDFTFMIYKRSIRAGEEFDRKHKLWDYSDRGFKY